jgi:hypothetical protein
MECVSCHKSDQPQEEEEVSVRLYKCPICFKHVCDDCATRNFGRLFCSKKCSDAFFFGDDDE